VTHEVDEEEKKDATHTIQKGTSFMFWDEDQNELYIRKRSGQKMFIHFKNLYINRIQFRRRLGLDSTEHGTPGKSDTKPYISEKSKKIATKYREKHLGKANAPLLEVLHRESKSQGKLMKEKEEREKKERAGYTFKPDTSPTRSYFAKGGAKKGSKEPTHGDKCLDLF